VGREARPFGSWRAPDTVRIGCRITLESGAGYRQITHLLQRPRRPAAIDAQYRHLTSLRLIRLFAPYLHDDTVWNLRQELVSGLAEHHRRSRGKTRRDEYQPVPMIEGRHFSISYALEALCALTKELPLTVEQVQNLVTAVDGVPYSQLSAWQVLSAHTWRPEDWPAAQKALKTLQAIHQTWETNALVGLLTRLNDAYPEEPATTDALMQRLLVTAVPTDPGQLPDPDRLSALVRWHALLERRRPGAVPFVEREAPGHFQAVVNALGSATGRESLHVGVSHPVCLLPLLMEHYPGTLSPVQLTALLGGLIQALGNTSLPVSHKQDLYQTLQALLHTLG
jgi:hypothetical protein